MSIFVATQNAVIGSVSGRLQIKDLNGQISHLRAFDSIKIGEEIIFNSESQFALIFENGEAITSDDINNFLTKELNNTTNNSSLSEGETENFHTQLSDDIESNYIQIERNAPETLATAEYDSSTAPQHQFVFRDKKIFQLIDDNQLDNKIDNTTDNTLHVNNILDTNEVISTVNVPKQIEQELTTTDITDNSFTTSINKPVDIDLTPFDFSLHLNPITGDNILTPNEAIDIVTLTGKVIGEYNADDKVNIGVNHSQYTVNIDNEGIFNLRIQGSELSKDNSVTASLTSTNNLGNEITQTATQVYVVSPIYTLEINEVTNDNIINKQESFDKVNITGRINGVETFPLPEVNSINIIISSAQEHIATITTLVSTNGEFNASIHGEYFSNHTNPLITATTQVVDLAGNKITLSTQKYFFIDRSDPVISLKLDPIADDNHLSFDESLGTVILSGHVTGEYHETDQVEIKVNEQVYKTHVNANGAFSLPISGSELSQDTQVFASFSSTDSAGNLAKVNDSQIYTVPPSYSLTLNNITDDNIINSEEIDGNLVISGSILNVKTGTFVANQEVYLTVITDKYPEGISTLAITDINGLFNREIDASNLIGHSDISITASTTIVDPTTDTRTTLSKAQSITLDIEGPIISLNLDPIAGDNHLTPSESLNLIEVSGQITGQFDISEPVEVSVNERIYKTSLNTEGEFSLSIDGNELRQDTSISASFSSKDDAGNLTQVIDSQEYTVKPMYTLELDNITNDNTINLVEMNGNVLLHGRINHIEPDEIADNQTVYLQLESQQGWRMTVMSLVDANGQFSAPIDGNKLTTESDLTIDLNTTITDTTGIDVNISASKTYAVDLTTPLVSLALNPITDDNYLSLNEANNDISITGLVTGDYHFDDQVIITINNQQHIASLNNEGVFNLSIAGNELKTDTRVTATLTTSDNAGNITTVTHHQDYAIALPPLSANPVDLIVDDLNPITIDPVDHSNDLIVDDLNPITLDPVDHSNDLIVDDLNPITIDPVDHSNDLIVDDLNPITLDPVDHSNDLIVDDLNPITIDPVDHSNDLIVDDLNPITLDPIPTLTTDTITAPVESPMLVDPVSTLTTDTITADNTLINTVDFSNNEGVDIFILKAESQGETHITGFDLNKDKLDLSDILQGEDDIDSLDNILHFSTEDGDTIIDIDSNHDGHMNQHLVLNGINLFTSYSVSSDNDMIHALIAKNSLIVKTNTAGSEPEPIEESSITFTA
ncbi:Ig-like domain-containing protein [uncultured Shewanella sp.]|uniref:Ig-like domain-containing protein n=1 Tax=uncultured Shewanella sp. TaxID=173975 RepID=UPI00260DB684|nr:Ig-like domain-containing protein [uncultured Shewanella sp.]